MINQIITVSDIFKYIKGCTVPKSGWDIIFQKEGSIEIENCGKVGKIFVEMKNKHNTMNSAASAKTYMKMQGQLLDDNNCVCFLVEVIAKNLKILFGKLHLMGKNKNIKKFAESALTNFTKLLPAKKTLFISYV